MNEPTLPPSARAPEPDPAAALAALHRRAFAAALVLAALVRLTLPEATSAAAIACNLLFVAAAVLVARGVERPGFALALPALWLPVALGWDWLSQTVLLLTVALAGVACGTPGALAAARWLAPALYFVAGWHKLNRDFLAPSTSCATHGLTQLAERLPALEGLVAWAPMSPAAFLTAELLLGLALLLRWARAPVAAALFHIPLTLALAPVFAFAALPLWVAALRPRDVARWRDAVRRRPVRRATLAVFALATPALLIAAVPGMEPDAAVRRTLDVVKASALLAACVPGLCLARAAAPVVASAACRRRRAPARVGAALALAWLLWCMQPYLGARMQHTGAMLSNLRIDAGCWNHRVVPESWRRIDPYVRLDSATAEHASALRDPDALTRIVRDTLWHPAQLHAMRSNWCSPRLGALRLQGSYAGERLIIDDLCDPRADLPGAVTWTGGRTARWPRMLRFQKNLGRACPTACVH